MNDIKKCDSHLADYNDFVQDNLTTKNIFWNSLFYWMYPVTVTDERWRKRILLNCDGMLDTILTTDAIAIHFSKTS